ncbi:MAG: YcxB family protein [Verrucomicrobiaceae bacterium]|nr:YcxB family protein [Verrucomicrobiaceae bacterium]
MSFNHAPFHMTPINFDVHITEALLRRVALRRIFRRWPFTLIAMVLIGIGIGFDLRRGQWSTLSIVGATALGFQVLLYLAVYLRQRRAIGDWKRQQGDAPVNYSLNDETIRAQSNLGSSELRWTVFTELIEHHDCLLLGFSRGNHLTLTRADVPAEALEFMRRKFHELKLPVKKG